MTSRVAILAVLLAISASQAMPLQRGFWDDARQLTHNSVEQAQQLKNRQGIENLKENLHDGTNYLGNVLEKLAPLNKALQPQFYQDAGGLWKLIRGELESLQMKISPYADEMHQRISQNLDQLQLHLTLLTEELADQVSLQAKKLEQHFRLNLSMKVQLPEAAGEVQAFVAFYAGKTAFLLDQVKEVFQPCAENMATAIHQSTEELHRTVAPQATAVWEQLSQFLEELTHNAKQLHLRAERNVDQLKQQLNIHLSILTAHLLQSQGDLHLALQPAFEHMAQEAQRTIEGFRKELFLHIENFRRTIDRELEEMRLKLSPSPLHIEQFQENSTSLYNLHSRLESLWKDIFRSLNESYSNH